MDPSLMRGNWNYPTSIRFGAGRIAELPDALAELGSSRPLLVTDPGLAELPMVDQIREIVEKAGLSMTMFSDVKPNPVEANVTSGVKAFTESSSDAVIALGGGSALDVGKAVALMVGQDRPLWDFEDVGDNYKRVNVAGMRPVVAVPTTAGTGAEVGRCSVITDSKTHSKRLIFHARMLPERVIADPELTLSLPKGLTAATGMDALSHNLEAFCSPMFHPQADGIAVEGMRLIHRSLIRTVADGSQVDTRADLLAASLMGATAFQKGLGAMHAMAHPIGAHLDTHHGLTNAVVMPYVLVHNREKIADRIGQLAAYLGLQRADFDGFLQWILTMREVIGIPHTLAEIGVTEEHVAVLAPEAAVDPSGGTNPVPLTTESLTGLLLRSIRGDLS